MLRVGPLDLGRATATTITATRRWRFASTRDPDDRLVPVGPRRVGEFPFFAHTPSRGEAIGWPGARTAVRDWCTTHADYHGGRDAHHRDTSCLCCDRRVRRATTSPIGIFTAALGVLFLSLGPNALRYSGETLRLLSVPQVFALLCIGVAIGRRCLAARRRRRLSRSMPSSGARNCPV